MIRHLWVISLFCIADGLLMPSKPAFSSRNIVTTTKRSENAYQTLSRQRPFLDDNLRCRKGFLPVLFATASAEAISSNGELLPGIDCINEMNDGFLEQLTKLTENSYFRLYSIDILASCEYMPQELFECYTESCEVYPVDEDEIPQEIKTADFNEHGFKLDGWARWDMPSDDYYDTKDFPEGYTGYDGSEIWNFIHNRICFEGYGFDDGHWKADFNKAVSGLHSMVSAQVIIGIQEKLDDGEEFGAEEKWRDPVQEFKRRLSPQGETSLALENLYFSYMILLQAALTAKTQILADCSSGKIPQEAAADLQQVFSSPLMSDPSVGVVSSKLHQHAVQDVGSLWEARKRSRDLLRIMNCVQCNKCRLHGKIGIKGLSTALKILVGDNGQGIGSEQLSRVEIATLMTALYKFSRVIKLCQEQVG